jgi:hypothetical protein
VVPVVAVVAVPTLPVLPVVPVVTLPEHNVSTQSVIPCKNTTSGSCGSTSSACGYSCGYGSTRSGSGPSSTCHFVLVVLNLQHGVNQ